MHFVFFSCFFSATFPFIKVLNDYTEQNLGHPEWHEDSILWHLPVSAIYDNTPLSLNSGSKIISKFIAIDELISGIYCIEVTIHLVSKGEPSLLGKVCLRTTQIAPTVAFAECWCCWAETWFHLPFWNCRFFKKEHWIIRTRILIYF